jgi:hypothetical protein
MKFRALPALLMTLFLVNRQASRSAASTTTTSTVAEAAGEERIVELLSAAQTYVSATEI